MAVLTSIVFVNFNQKEALRAALSTLDAQDGAPAAEILVIDNASFDGSAEMVAEEFPPVRLVRLNSNLGFAAAANRGLLESAGAAVVLCHADVIATVHVLLELADRVREGESRRVAAVFPRQIGLDRCEKPYVARFPGLGRGMVGVFNPPVARGHIVPSLDHVTDAEFGSFACCALNADVVTQIGGFDEKFFLYYADADLCRRLHERDYRILLARNLHVVHVGGLNPPPHLQRIMRNDQLRYFSKHQPTWQHKVLSAAARVRQLVAKE